MQKIIYMDNAATTRMTGEVREAMLPYLSELYSNPSSIYEFAKHNRKQMEISREKIASMINASPQEIYFTSGGTESDNWALKGTIEATGRHHVVTSAIEHHAILHSCDALHRQGNVIDYVRPDEWGYISPAGIEKCINENTALVSVMMANNEVGTIQPVEEIGEICRRRGVAFHTDAVQAFGHIPIDVRKMNIDMMSASGHKFGGPKGVGFLYVRSGMNIASYMNGGSQEDGKRAGTYNVPGIIGMGKAAEIAGKNMLDRMRQETELREAMITRILSEVPYTRLNGRYDMRLPGNASFSFQFIDGEALLVMLDEKGICASAGSACTASSAKPSHVLMAMGIPEEIAFGTLRFSLSYENTMDEVNYVCGVVCELVRQLRSYSETYEKYVRNS